VSGGTQQPRAQAAITQVEAARRYGVTDRTIRNWEKRGHIAGKRVDGLKFYPVAQLDRLTGADKQ
jgi:DNA-binding transcriptional MerR regulator